MKKSAICWPGALQRFEVALMAAWLSMAIDVSSRNSSCCSSEAAKVSPTSSASYTVWCLSEPR